MEVISSRKNGYIRRIRELASDRAFREKEREFLCDGHKLLGEALSFGAEITSVLWKGKPGSAVHAPDTVQYAATEDVFDFASPMKNSPGPLFTVKMKAPDIDTPVNRVIVLETVQDPGNVGTVIRTASAFNMDAVILTGDCADLYHPKTTRATMGAIFRQRVLTMNAEELASFLQKNNMPLYGAALSDSAEDIRRVSDDRAAYAVGSEGNGLSKELLSLCDKQVIIPMNPQSESLNAAVAASVIMWIVSGQEL